MSTSWSAAKRKKYMKFYRECIRRQIYLNGSDKIHLSKNPVFAGRVAALLEEFPDARFVVPVRNPYETIPSLLKLMRAGWKSLDWEESRQTHCLAFLANQSFHTYKYPLEVLAKRSDVPHAVVDYRDLLAEPATTIEKVYQDIGLEMSDRYRGVLAGEATRARQHKTTHRYSLEEFGLEADAIHQELAMLFERFGWEDAVASRDERPATNETPTA